MKTVITDKNDVVLALGTEFHEDTVDTVVWWLDGCGYRIFGQKVYKNVDVADNITPELYTFDGTTFTPYQSEIDRIMQEAIDKYTEELLEGGLL